MLDALYEFSIRIAAMAVLCALAECLIPNGKLKKTVRLCVGIVFVLCIAAPIAGCVQQDLPKLSLNSLPMQDTLLPTHEELLRGYYEKSLAIE